jgi:hypothetical protein
MTINIHCPLLFLIFFSHQERDFISIVFATLFFNYYQLKYFRQDPLNCESVQATFCSVVGVMGHPSMYRERARARARAMRQGLDRTQRHTRTFLPELVSVAVTAAT